MVHCGIASMQKILIRIYSLPDQKRMITFDPLALFLSPIFRKNLGKYIKKVSEYFFENLICKQTLAFQILPTNNIWLTDKASFGIGFRKIVEINIQQNSLVISWWKFPESFLDDEKRSYYSSSLEIVYVVALLCCVVLCCCVVTHFNF